MMNFVNSKRLLLVCGMTLTLMCAACSDDDAPASQTDPEPTPAPAENGARFLKDKDKLAMVHSLVDLEGNKGRIYEMKYTVDYKLDEALNAGIDGTETLKAFVAQHLLDTIYSTKELNLSYSAGCSALACPDQESGDFLMGRNFDFNHLVPGTTDRIMIPLIVVHTAPEGGKKSVSFVDGLFVDYKSGFYTDGHSDLSMLMALPYLLLDGINEDGFAVSVLKLDGLPTRQQKEGRKKTFTTIAMRMLLDRASTVNEAVEMLDKYNMCMDKDTASYHFFMADATGDYAIVEYTNSNLKVHPDAMEVLRGVDTMRCVTNFYVSPTMVDTKYGMRHSLHGRERYWKLRDALVKQNYNMNAPQVMDALGIVAQGPYDTYESTGFTQWSEVFNLTKKRVSMSILREFDKTFEFGVE